MYSNVFPDFLRKYVLDLYFTHIKSISSETFLNLCFYEAYFVLFHHSFL